MFVFWVFEESFRSRRSLKNIFWTIYYTLENVENIEIVFLLRFWELVDGVEACGFSDAFTAIWDFGETDMGICFVFQPILRPRINFRLVKINITKLFGKIGNFIISNNSLSSLYFYCIISLILTGPRIIARIIRKIRNFH